uniref:Uncharacterized protein n=1 Tax=Anguilla anguilla TaxID=7936 RepID=A0A0E9PRC2_ANGAN
MRLLNIDTLLASTASLLSMALQACLELSHGFKLHYKQPAEQKKIALELIMS